MKKNNNYVYHGSPRSFTTATPKRNVRSRYKNGEEEVIFDDASFHATPHRWIALAYTYNPKQTYKLDGKKVYYNIGVSLYDSRKMVSILGFGSLENSLKKLYGKGGYLLTFDGKEFFHTEGLGDLEVITQKPIRPESVERIEDPVAQLKEVGVMFQFVDLARQENSKLRNFAKK